MRADGLLDLQRWSWRLLVLEAAVWLTLSGLALRLLPFRRVATLLGPLSPAGGTGAPDPGEAAHRQARRIGAAVVRAARWLPWQPVCLPQAMAGKAMLACRGVRSTLHLGAATDPAEGLSAHAWLMLGTLAVTGGAGRERYAELGRFG